jgi:glycosyltransferase involved in cell wall biosynthesis
MRRILYITANPPAPLHDGGAQRTLHLQRALQAVGQVDLVVVSRSHLPQREELVREHGLVADFIVKLPGDRRPFRWFNQLHPNLVYGLAKAAVPRWIDYRPERAIAREVRRLIAERKYDLIVGRYLTSMLKAGAVGQGVPCALDVDDLDTQLIKSQLNQPGLGRGQRLVYHWHYFQASQLAPRSLRRFDLLWVCNEEEMAPGGELSDFANKVYLPNIPLRPQAEVQGALSDIRPIPTDKPPMVLFVGNLSWKLNVQGLDHFVQRIWPMVREAEPTATLRIVGAKMSEAQKQRWSAVGGVEAIGFVEDLRASYADCRFTVVPLFSGAGTNIKVIESLFQGRTCVVTHHAHRGFRSTLPDGQALLTAESDDEMARHCITLLRDPSLCERLARMGQGQVEQHYSFDRFRRIVGESVENVLTRRGASNAEAAAGSRLANDNASAGVMG